MDEPSRKQRQLSAKRRQKLGLFRAGARAVHCLNPAHENLYACPLCRQLWVEEAIDAGVLTLEHVPPASMGGKGLALTCKDCNDRAGSEIDAHLRARQDFLDLGRALVGRSRQGQHEGRAELDVGGQVTRADIEVRDGKLAIRVDQRRNDPDKWAGQVSQLKDGEAHEASTTMSLTVRSKHRWELRRSLVSDLKSAYLATFALFGYRYALDARLDPIREQIRIPEAELVEGAWWIAPADIERDPTLILLRRPFPGVLVRMRDAMVLLPWTSSPDDFYQAVRAHFAEGTPADFGGTEYDWPTTLELQWDLRLCEEQPEDPPPAVTG